jgi:hypothetical protein
MRSRFLYNRDVKARFRYILTTFAQFAEDVSLAPDDRSPRQHDLRLGAQARETLAAIDASDALGAAYAGFRCGALVESQHEWMRKVEAMIRGKERSNEETETPKDVDLHARLYSDETKDAAVAEYNAMLRDDPGQKMSTAATRVAAKYGCHPGTLRRWHKESLNGL